MSINLEGDSQWAFSPLLQESINNWENIEQLHSNANEANQNNKQTDQSSKQKDHSNIFGFFKPLKEKRNLETLDPNYLNEDEETRLNEGVKKIKQ